MPVADDCLPEHLRGAAITRFPSGLSGAEVYRVERDGHAYVLKIAAAHADPIDWRHKLAVLQLAGDAGVAPRVIHVDDARRAVVSELVVDRGFMPFLMSPATRAQAIDALGRTIRRVHALPIPPGTPPATARAMLERISASFAPGYLPPFARDYFARVLAETPPTTGALVTSHNDLNPSNVSFDGERIVLLDWDAAAPNDRYFDLAAVSLFMRFDDATVIALLAAYGEPTDALPDGIRYARRLVAALCGALFIHLARNAGHPGATGATGDESLERCDGLAELYPKLRTGQLDVASPAGQWQFGIALVKAGLA